MEKTIVKQEVEVDAYVVSRRELEIIHELIMQSFERHMHFSADFLNLRDDVNRLMYR